MSENKKSANLITKETYEKLLVKKAKLEKELTRIRKEYGTSREGEGAWTGHAHDHAPYIGKLSNLTFEIDKISETLKNPTFVKKKKGCSSVQVGTTIEIELDGEQIKVTVLGDRDAEVSDNVISSGSPLAKALLGHKTGDIVTVKTPTGLCKVRILSIE